MQKLFGDLIQRSKDYVPEDRNLQDPDFSYHYMFKSVVPNIPNMSEHDIAVAVKNGIDEIAYDILTENIYYANLFVTCPNFMEGFTRAISSIPITSNIIVACNKLTYDYFTSNNPIHEIKKKFLHISSIVNKRQITQLCAIGLDNDTACNLALCRNSSTTEGTNIKRLNFAMYNRDPMMMSEQIIINIYECLFDRVGSLFNEIMLETYTSQQEADFGNNFMEIYGITGLAILDIINNMTSENIMKVLSGYVEEWKFRSKPRVRFTLRSLSADYYRIGNVVEKLDREGIYIP